MKQNFTLNTTTSFKDFDEEMIKMYDFQKKHPFSKTLTKICQLLKDDLPRYEIALGCTCNEIEEVCGTYEYGFNCTPTQIANLVEDILSYCAMYDFIFRKEDGTADVKKSNHADVAKQLNKLVAIATA